MVRLQAGFIYSVDSFTPKKILYYKHKQYEPSIWLTHYEMYKEWKIKIVLFHEGNRVDELTELQWTSAAGQNGSIVPHPLGSGQKSERPAELHAAETGGQTQLDSSAEQRASLCPRNDVS